MLALVYGISDQSDAGVHLQERTAHCLSWWYEYSGCDTTGVVDEEESGKNCLGVLRGEMMPRDAQVRQSARCSIWNPWRQLRQRMCDLLSHTDQSGWTRFYHAWCLDVASGGSSSVMEEFFPYTEEETQRATPTTDIRLRGDTLPSGR